MNGITERTVPEMVDRCVCCGAEIPEGRQVCPKCESKVKEQTVTIVLNKRQAGIVLAALEEWFRLRMGQAYDLANGLAFLGYKHDKEHPEKFDRTIQKRDSIDAVIKAMFNIAWPHYGYPEKTEPEVHIASDIWSALRWELSPKNELAGSPFQMGPEPMPKITVEDVRDGN